MNGEQLVAEAAKLIAKGESYYHQAAEKIEQAAERGIPNTEIAVGLGRSEAWVRALRNWNTQGSQGTTNLPFSEPQGAVAQRHARSVLRESTAEQLREIMDTLPVERRAEVVRAAVPPPERTSAARSAPSFIELLVRVNTALIELEAMVASWQNLAAIPTEFSRDSFTDVVAKALRIQDHFDAVADNRDDEDEFQKIVRNFKVTSDVS